MKNIIGLLIAAVVVASFSPQGQRIDYAKIEMLTEKIAPNLYMLSGSAGADPGQRLAAGSATTPPVTPTSSRWEPCYLPAKS